MSHLSIGIIKHSKGKKTSYLVMKVFNTEQYKFFEINSTALGASFDFNSFKKHFHDYFELGEKIEDNNFKFLDESDWKSEKQPAATIYEIGLNDKHKKTIDSQSVEKGLRWVKEEELGEIKWEERQRPLISGTIEKIQSAKLVSFDNDFLASVETLQDAMKSGKLVIFAGAGVSVNSGIPLWSELIKELKEDITVEKDEKNYLVLAQLHYNSRLQKEYHERVQSILKHNKVRPNPLHSQILELNPMHVITTNYDNLFEQEIESQALPYSIVKKDNDLSYTLTPNLLVKMHGDFDERNIVLKEDDYLNYAENFPLIEGFVKGVFASKVVLFIGFSFDDINLKYILQHVKTILGDDLQPAYLFSPTPTEKVRIDYLKCKGVHVISTSDKVEGYLMDRKVLDNVFTKEKELKERKTYNFLKFLMEYNRFTERRKDLSIIDKMYYSLEPFQELPFIPTSELIKLPPFAIENRFKAQYGNYYTLQTRDENILNLLSKIKINDRELEIEGLKLSEDELEKLKLVLSHLNTSCILRVRRQSDFINPKIHDIYLPDKVSCNCKRCLNSSLNFSKLILELNNGSINKANTQHDDPELIKAYCHFKVGNFLESYEVLKTISQESWYRGKYITYFLCKYNMIRLRTAIQYSWDSFYVNKEETDEALKALKKIDIDAILQQLPVEGYIKEALKQIRLETFLRETEKGVRENLEGIKKTFKDYQSEGFYQEGGVNHVDLLREKFIRLHLYYMHNLLFENEFLPFYSLTNLFWEGLIISYSTRKEYKPKQKSFHSSVLRPVIYYAHPDIVLKTLEDYKVETLLLDKETIETITRDANNFFKSNHRTTTLFETSAYKNESHFFQQEKSQFYKSKSIKIFRNLLIVLAYADLSRYKNKDCNELIINLLRSFRIDKELKSSLDYFKIFVSKKIELFNHYAIKLLLDITIDDDFWSDELIENVVESVLKTDYRIDNREYLDKVFARITPRRGWRIFPISILPLYQLFTRELKKKFKEKVIANLDAENVKNGEMSKYYRKAVDLGIIDWNKNKLFNSYCNFVIDRFPLAKQVKFTDEGKAETSNREGIDVVFNFAHFVYQNEIPIESYKDLLNRKNIPSYLLWLLDPKNFDYRKFSVKWVLVFNSPVFIEQFKGIDALESKLESYLKKNFNSELAEVYFNLVK